MKALTHPQQWNRYAYVTNNPLKLIDPDGRQTVCGACQQLVQQSAVLRDRIAQWFGANDPQQSGLMQFAEVVSDTALALVAPRNADEMNSSLMAGPLGILENAAAGRAAERAAGIIMNTEHIPSLSNSANFRIPDILSHASKLIGDIKVNGTTLRLTAQLRDFIEYAERQGYKFILRVSDPGKVHPALRMEIERIGGQIEGMD